MTCDKRPCRAGTPFSTLTTTMHDLLSNRRGVNLIMDTRIDPQRQRDRRTAFNTYVERCSRLGATNVLALSSAPRVRHLMSGALQAGVSIGSGCIDINGYVLMITSPFAFRMPNGLEVDARFEDGERVSLGDGSLHGCRTRVVAGPEWHPKPLVRFVPMMKSFSEMDCGGHVGWGPGLTPLGDQLFSGYLGGLALLGQPASYSVLPARGDTTDLSLTLLGHARVGELPEPAHELIANARMSALLNGGPSGAATLIGLAICARRVIKSGERASVWKVEPFADPFEIRPDLPGGAREFTIQIHQLSAS